jgi:cysteine synthase A
LKLDTLDEVLAVSDGDSILMAQKLAATLGLGVGISLGCNFLAAVMAQERLAEGAVVATVFCDDSKKYMSTGLFSSEPVCEGYLTPRIELLDFKVIGRLHGSTHLSGGDVFHVDEGLPVDTGICIW